MTQTISLAANAISSPTYNGCEAIQQSLVSQRTADEDDLVSAALCHLFQERSPYSLSPVVLVDQIAFHNFPDSGNRRVCWYLSSSFSGRFTGNPVCWTGAVTAPGSPQFIVVVHEQYVRSTSVL